MGSNIFFSGLSSGIDTASIVDQLIALERRPVQTLTQKVNTLNKYRTEMTSVRGKVSKLQTSIQTLTDSKIGGSFDIFRKKAATSSNAAKVSASVTNTAADNNLAVSVSRLATATRASSVSGVGQVSTGTTLLSEISAGSLTSGNFSVFVNGARQDITVNAATDTMNDVLGRISAVLPGGSASVDGTGKIQLSMTSGTTLQFGSASDTANFAQLTGLTPGVLTPGGGTDTFAGAFGVNTVLSSGTLTNNAVRFATTVTAGTVTIAGDAYTIDGTTTLDSLMQAVNAKNKVVMSLDQKNNTVSMVSKTTGEQAISLGASGDTSNFLSAAGLLVGGNSLTSQTLGVNALFNVNGVAYTSTSNTGITNSVHGFTGVTLDLKDVTGPDVVNVAVATDKEAIKTAMTDFLTAFNDVLKTISDKTNVDTGTLPADQSLIRLRSSLRSGMSQAASGLTTYTTLSRIGITSGAPTASPGQTGSSTFSLDDSKFFAALADNPDEVKTLLVGNGTVTGLLEGVKTSVIDGSLNAEFGLFSSRDKSLNEQLKTTNDSITRMTQRLDRREKSLRAQFTAMEQAIARLRSQQSSLG
jgi:flagellar hook-associated protein 2